MRCLIVDDNERFLTAARELLEREGIRVVGVASTGAEAFQRMRELRPEVTLIDIDLGGESGFDVVRVIAADPSLSASRVILISTHAQSDYSELIEASAVVGFVAKSDLSASAIQVVLGGERDPEPG